MSIIFVTGASRGIGLALCALHAARGDHVFAAVRQPSAALQALPVSILDGVDMLDPASIAALPARLADVRLDRLMLNAGALGEETLGSLDAVSIQRQFEVNALGPLRTVDALRGRLAPRAKIGLVTSRMGSIQDNASGGYYGYRMSKAALNAAGRSLAHDLRPLGASVFLLHPGFVRTAMTGGQGDRSPEEAAAMLAARMDALGPEDSGSFWHANGTPLPW